jgi:site-specific recombinase XerD
LPARRRDCTRGPEFADRADELELAFTHWLRHTVGSHQTDSGVDLRAIRDNPGHVFPATYR